MASKVMGKPNRFSVGDRVRHREAPALIFEVVEVMTAVPEKSGDCLYVCKLVSGSRRSKKAWKYHEQDLLGSGAR